MHLEADVIHLQAKTPNGEAIDLTLLRSMTMSV